jgi:hypothetical protein
MRRLTVRLLEQGSLAALVLSASSGMLLGSGVSATARGVFVVLASSAFVLAVLAMGLAGRLRVVASPLWWALLLVPILGVAQWWPGISSLSASVGIPAESLGSLHRHATLHQVIWWSAGLLYVAAWTMQVRTMSRAVSVASILTLVLWGVGLVGWGQSLLGRGELMGWVSLDDPRLPAVVSDVFSTRSAAGLLAYRPWESTSSLEVPMYFPMHHRADLFGGFLSARDWSACVVVLLPMLMGVCVYLGGFAGVGGWRTHQQSRQMSLLWLVGLAMVATSAWMGDPVTVPTVATLSLFVVVVMVSAEDRKRAYGLGIAYLLAMGGVCGAYALMKGTPAFASTLERWIADNRTLVDVFGEHWLLGTGLGTFGDIWPSYRSAPASLPHQVSSLAVWIVETGVVGGAMLALATLYVLIRALVVCRRLDAGGRAMLAGSLGGLVALVLTSLAGSGFELPVVMTIALSLWSVLMRSLAGGYRMEDAACLT